ncbi:Pentatricopeptide repeat-containing protein At5g65560 [Durusdinium trenchii]|uniref:Pentatricopeptide repeat-containing protein At5g65560 n=1 Tax=Durusdinium trenchii TaxID=1381693 RepID=A0ABP0NX75_9DINO
MAWNTMLKAHAIAGDMDGAATHFAEMQLQRVPVNTRTFGKLIRCAAEAGQPEQAVRFLREHQQHGLASDLVSQTSVVDAFAKAGCPEEAETWLEALEGLGEDEVALGLLAAGYARLGKGFETRRCLERLLAAGAKPTSETWGLQASAWARQGETARAAHWLQEMVEMKLQPSSSTLAVLLSACAKSQDSQSAARIQSLCPQGAEMADGNDGDRAHPGHVYNAALQSASHSGEAEVKLKEMSDAKLKPNLLTYNSLKLGVGQGVVVVLV